MLVFLLDRKEELRMLRLFLLTISTTLAISQLTQGMYILNLRGDVIYHTLKEKHARLNTYHLQLSIQIHSTKTPVLEHRRLPTAPTMVLEAMTGVYEWRYLD